MAATATAAVDGRVALVTGASSGIGAAIVRRLCEAGWRTVAAARRVGRLRALADELGPLCHPVALDVVDDASVASLLDRLPEALRAIDALVNNAGQDVGGNVPFDRGDGADWLSTLDVNVGGLFRVTRAILPGMVARGRGDIVNIGSIAGRQPSPTLAVYSATKHALRGFSASLRAEHAADNIRVIEIAPGVVETEFALRRWRDDAERAKAFYESFPGALTPDDVARSTLFALSQPPGVTVAELFLLPTRMTR